MLLIAMLLGAFLAYFSTLNRKTLPRIPYICCFSLIFCLYVILTYLNELLLHAIFDDELNIYRLVLELIPIFLFGFFFMKVSVARAYDGFDSKKAAWLLIVPLANLGLFTVTVDEDPDTEPLQRDPINCPAFIQGASGLIIATIIAMLSFTIGVIAISLPHQRQLENRIYKEQLLPSQYRNF